MKKTSILSLLLALLLVVSAVMSVSCADNNGNETDAPQKTDAVQTSEGNTEPAVTEPEFSTKKYNGEKFVVYLRDPNTANYAGLYIVPEADATDVISSQAEKRNQMVEARFDIVLENKVAMNPYNTLKKDINDGNPGYQLVLDQRRYVGPLGLEGLLSNFNTLDVDLTTSWWDANAANQYSVCNKLYIMPCDISISNLGGVRFFCFNKAVLENFHLTSPYEYASKNQWTLQTFCELVKGVSAPGTDTEFGIYGFVNETKNVREGMIVGCGIPWIEKTSESTFEITIGTTYKDRAQSFIDTLKEVTSDSTHVMDFDTAHTTDKAGQSAYGDKYSHCRGLFATDHFLFVHTNMNCIKDEFTDMSKGFGVIMNPKFNSDQDNYYHKMDWNSICFAIPAYADNDAQMVVDIMDYWAYVSTSTVMEAYYEITLKSKRSNDPQAAEMLDTIKGSIGYFITDLYSLDISSLVSDAFTKGIDSAWSSYQKTLPKQLNTYIPKLNK